MIEAKSDYRFLAQLSFLVSVLYSFCYVILRYEPTILMFKSFFPFSKIILHILK